jgi:hypothetical protein
MDGRYTLRHRKIEGLAELAVAGLKLRVSVPPAAAVVRALDSHAGAVAAMNAELTRLIGSGWSLADVAADDHDAHSEDEAQSTRDEEEDGLDAVVTSVERDGATVTVNAGESEVTRDQALAALLNELAKEPCHELVISDSQEYKAPWYQSVEPWCLALAALGSKTLGRFVVDTYFQPLTRQASVYCGDVTGVFRACPALSFAYIVGCAEIGALAHDRLEDLTLMAEPLEVGTIRSVLRGPCPRLARLALGLAYEGAPAAHADRALITAFSENNLTALTELHIAYPSDGVAMLDAIVSSPAFANLRVLSIEGNVFEKEKRGLTILKKHRESLSKLERLHLPLEDVMSKTDDELLAMIPSLRSADDVKAFDPSRYRDASR